MSFATCDREGPAPEQIVVGASHRPARLVHDTALQSFTMNAGLSVLFFIGISAGALVARRAREPVRRAQTSTWWR